MSYQGAGCTLRGHTHGCYPRVPATTSHLPHGEPLSHRLLASRHGKQVKRRCGTDRPLAAALDHRGAEHLHRPGQSASLDQDHPRKTDDEFYLFNSGELAPLALVGGGVSRSIAFLGQRSINQEEADLTLKVSHFKRPHLNL